MKWVTRERPKTDRIACPWPVRKFIDPKAEILYVPAEEVLEVARREGAHSFDAPGAKYHHRGQKCTFEVLLEEFQLGGDAALVLLARIIHGADIRGDEDMTPQSPGLRAIAEGFIDVEPDDRKLLEVGSRIYDALYASCRRQVGV